MTVKGLYWFKEVILQYQFKPAIKGSPVRMGLELLLFKIKQCSDALETILAFHECTQEIIIVMTDEVARYLNCLKSSVAMAKELT